MNTPVASADEHPIAQLRKGLGLTQLDFAARIGLANKASVSLIERGLAPISPDVALAIEELSDGRIDAAGLNPIISKARHGVDAATPEPTPSSGKTEAISQEETR